MSTLINVAQVCADYHVGTLIKRLCMEIIHNREHRATDAYLEKYKDCLAQFLIMHNYLENSNNCPFFAPG